MATDNDRVALAAFLTTAVLAGGNAVAIRIGNRELDPLWAAGVRFGVSAAILLGVMAVRRLPMPRGPALRGAILYGLINFGLTFALAYYAYTRIHAGLGQTILATVPLATLLLAVAQRQERLRPAAVVGTMLALVGVGVISEASFGEGIPVLALLALLGSALSFGEAAVLIRRLPRVHPVTMNAVGMTAGAVFLLAASLVTGESWAIPQRSATWLSLGYLVVFGSVAVFVLFLVVLKYWAASRAAYVFVLSPIVAVFLSAWLDNEPIHAGLVLGGLLILAGVYVGALRPAERAEPAPTATDPT